MSGTSPLARRTPEAEALLAAVRAALGGEAPPTAVLAAADPHRLAELARRHECDAMLYAALAGANERRLPAAVRDALALTYHRNGLRNRWLAARVGQLLAELAAAGAAAMPLKGVTIAFGAYPAPELRPVGDLDLLVHEDDFPAVAATLHRLGWAAALPPLAPRELPRYAQTIGQVRFAGPQPPIEVHFRLLHDGLPAPREEAWADPASIALPGLAAPLAVPSPERTLLHLALHAVQHGFSRLRLLADLAAFVRRAPLDAGRLAALARRHRLTTAAWLAWSWADRLLACGPPPDALTPPAWRRRLAETLHRRDRVLALAADRLPREAELPLAHLAGGASPGAKLAFAAAVLWPPRGWLPPGGRRRHLARLAGGIGGVVRRGRGAERPPIAATESPRLPRVVAVEVEPR